MPTITIQQRARNVQILLKRYGQIQDDAVAEHLRELLNALTAERPCFEVEPDTLIYFKDVGIQVRAGFNPDMESGQPYATVNTEDLPPAHRYGEHDGSPAIAVHLNDAALYDDTGSGNTASVVGTPTVYVVRPGDVSEDVAVFSQERHAQRFRDTYDDSDCGDVEQVTVCDFDLMLEMVAQREGDVPARLEYLRGELRAERISMGELHELQGLAEHIEPGDVELLEAAGVPEHDNPEELPYAVIDTRPDSGPVKVGEQYPVLGRFATEDEASAFIATQPDHLDGRYGLDGPER